MLTALMAATEPAITPSELQKNCEKLAAEKFNRETANDEDRFGYGGHYNARLKSAFIGRLTYLIRLWVLTCGYTYLISKIIEFTAGITGPPILAFFTATFKTSNATQQASGTRLHGGDSRQYCGTNHE